MRQGQTLIHKFVEFIPDVLEEGTLYVSMECATVVHKCCCGCGKEVVTPLSPADWSLIFNGKTVSLDPSIGNWGFECQSHYWIRNNRVRWAAQWSPEEIAAGRARDRFAKERYFDAAGAATEGAPKDTPVTVEPAKEKPGIWQKIKKWWHGS
jgi:Family of unknown function (DUF6527)